MRWLQLLPALGLAAWGAHLWAGPEPRWFLGTCVQGAAFAGILFSFPLRFPPALAAAPAAGAPQASLPVPFRLSPFLLAAAAEVLFLRGLWRGGLLTAAAAAFAAFAVRRRAGDPEGPGASLPRERLWLLALLALAALPRFLFLETHFAGLQIDEANSLEGAQRMARGVDASPFRTIWMGNPSFTHAFTALAFLLFGDSLTTGRAVSGVLSLLAIWFFFRWCRLSFGGPASLAATFLFSACAWHLFFARSPFHNAFTLAFAAGVFFLAERALRGGGRFCAVGAGLLAAGAVMSYASGRLVPAAFAAVLASGWLLGVPCFRKSWRPTLAGAAGFLWLLGPFLLFIREIPSEFFGRTAQLNVLPDVAATGDWSPVLRRLVDTLRALSGPLEAGVDPRFHVPGTPLLGPVLAPLAGLGILLSLLTPRRWSSRAVLFGTAAGLSANVLARDPQFSYTVNALRFFVVLPFLAYAAARTLDWGFHLMRGAPLPSRRVALMTLAILLAGSALIHGRTYFVEFRKNPLCWNTQGHIHVLLGEEYRKLPAGTAAVGHWEMFASPAMFLAGEGFSPLRLEEITLPLPAPEGGRDAAFFVLRSRTHTLEERLRALYPSARRREVRNPWNEVLFVVWEIPARELREALESPDL